MNHPLVVHCQKAPYDVLVDRSTEWGNPFRIGRDGTRAEVLLKYRKWLPEHPEIIEAAKEQLRGKTLGCWCAPEACHADILAEVANS